MDVADQPRLVAWCPGQWHPTGYQYRPGGATDLSFGRSVAESADYSLFDSALV